MGHVGKTVTQNVVSGSEITDGTVTGADLASDIAISTSGNISTTGDLTVDSGTLFVDASENKVGIGTTTVRNNLDFGVTSNNDHIIALRDNNVSRTILGLTNGYGVRVGAPSDGTSTENMFEVGQINASDGTTYQNTKFAVTYAGNVNATNTSSTGSTISLGTTSTSVSNGGYIGGIMFTGGSANTATGRIQALSNGQTDAGATGTGADFSFECRNNNASFTEKFLIKGSGDISIQKNTNGFGNFTSFGTVTLADDASITIADGNHCGGANHLYVYETSTGSNCVYYGGFNKTAVLTNNYLETGGIGFASANSDGNVSFYSDGAHSLTFQNREGSSKTFKLMKVGVGATFNDTA